MHSLQVSAVVRLFLALWLAITPTFVWAGSMTLMGVGGGSAALSPVTLTFQTGTAGTHADPVQTMAFTIGAAASSNRRVIVVWGTLQTATSETFTAVFTPNVGSPVTADTKGMVGGVADGLGQSINWASAVLPTGTTVSLDVSWSASINANPNFAVYTVDNSTLSSPTSPTINGALSNTAVTTISTNANTAAGAGVIAYGITVNPPNSFTSSPSGIVSDSNFGQFSWGSKSNVAASTPYTVTQTFTSTADVDIAIFVWR